MEDRNEPLTKLEIKEYRKMTGKIAWLANSTRPDLSFIALKMSKNSKEATISDLRDVNQILAKVKEQESKVKIILLERKLVGIGDALLQTGYKAVVEVMLFLTNSTMTRASPIYWKAKKIDRVCYSSKDAETLNLLTAVKDSIHAANQL